MNLALITPPTVAVVTLEEAKQHLRVDHNDDDAHIAGVISAAVSSLDPAGGGFLGRALRPQTWELRLPGFPTYPVALPYPPFVSTVSVKYDDADGVEQTVAAPNYRVLGAGGLAPVRLDTAYGFSWPSARCDAEAVRVRFTCGYAVAGEVDALPAAIKAAILLMVGDLYEFRETAAVGTVSFKIPASTTVDWLLAPYRVF